MQVEFSVRIGTSEHDVVLRCPHGTTMQQVLAHLLDAVDAAPDLRADGVEPDQVVGVHPVVDGCSIDLVRAARLRSDPTRGDGLELVVVGGLESGRRVSVGAEPVRIGRDPSCALSLHDARVSRIHASVRRTAAGVMITDHDSTNGTRIEGTIASSGSPIRLALDEIVRMGDTLLAVREVGTHAPEVVEPADVVVDGDSRVANPLGRRVQWLAVALPALAGAGVAWATGSAVFLLFALLSPIMMIATGLGERVEEHRARRGRARTRRTRQALEDRQVAAALRDELRWRRASHPDPEALVASIARGSTRPRVVDPSGGGRGPGDGLTVRVGSADLPSRTKIRRDGVEQPAAVLPAVPVLIDLAGQPLTLVGTRAQTEAAARAIVTQLAARHAPYELELALFLSGPAAEHRWSWARWLPHLAQRVAVGTTSWPALAAQLSQRGEASAATATTVVAVVDGWCDELVSMFAAPHVTGLLLAASPRAAAGPGRVLEVAGCDGDEDRDAVVVCDGVPTTWAADLARLLAGAVTVTRARQVPDSCHLLDVIGIERLDPAQVARAWSAGDGAAGTTLGRSADGKVEVDLARDGPHALVAGTTGAGKSELLRTWVLGLAAMHPPDMINFLLIDFKGGATFGCCADLPHVAGTVTDLDARLASRALNSLDVELRRRESLFAQVGVSDLEGYRDLGDESVARLVIMVDEFAALAEELPDVLRGLVSIAQRGRSLGVHLVLATQRPGTAVTADIRANTALRIALRVVDPLESHEMLGTARAAAISPRAHGRALLARGTDTVEFQAAAIGGVTRENDTDISIRRLGPWRSETDGPTQEDRTDTCRTLVRAVVDAALSSGRPRARPLWAPPLPHQLRAETLPVDASSRLGIGLVDRPTDLRHDIVWADLDVPASWAVVGAAGTGRTNALMCLALEAARSRAPDELHVHVVDASGALASALRGLPHVRSCLGPGELASAPTLFRALTARVQSDRARILLLVDHTERLPDDGGPAAGAGLEALLRNRGATVMLGGGRGLLTSRLIGEIAHRIVLRMDDRADYALAGVAARDVPDDPAPGRGVRVSDGALLQLALARTPRDLVADEIRTRWRGIPCAGGVRVRPLPQVVELDELTSRPDALRVGAAGDNADALHLRTAAGAIRMLVVGRARTGRTSTLTTLLHEARRVGLSGVVVSDPASALSSNARALGVSTIDPSEHGVRELRDPRTVVFVDDAERVGGIAIDDLVSALAQPTEGPSIVASADLDSVALAFQGLVAELRRAGSVLVLRPSPADLVLFGAEAAQSAPLLRQGDPPGRGVFCGVADELSLAGYDGPVRPSTPLVVQVARPPTERGGR